MHIVIDLFGDDEVVSVQPEESPEEKLCREQERLQIIDEFRRRAPRPQVIPVTHHSEMNR